MPVTRGFGCTRAGITRLHRAVAVVVTAGATAVIMAWVRLSGIRVVDVVAGAVAHTAVVAHHVMGMVGVVVLSLVVVVVVVGVRVGLMVAIAGMGRG